MVYRDRPSANLRKVGGAVAEPGERRKEESGKFAGFRVIGRSSAGVANEHLQRARHDDHLMQICITGIWTALSPEWVRKVAHPRHTGKSIGAILRPLIPRFTSLASRVYGSWRAPKRR